MKTNIYTIIAGALVTSLCINATAQTWHSKHAGLPNSFNARSIYGEGTGMMIANNSPSAGAQLYYTADTSTPVTGSTSSFGTFAALQTGIAKCKGAYFLGGVGGVYKSTDNGHKWTITGTGSVQTSGLYAYNDTLYANLSMSAGAINYSTDAGTTWTTMPAFSGSAVLKFLKSAGVLYAGTSGGLHYSADNGATWNAITTPSTLSGQNINGLVEFQGSVYASCVNGVFKSSDKGVTWTNMTTTPMNSMTAVDTSLLCGTTVNGVYQSDMSATNWTQIKNGLPINFSTLLYSINDITSNSEFIIASAQLSDSAIYVIKLSDLGLKPNVVPPPTTGLQRITAQEITFAVYPNPAKNEATITLNSLTENTTVGLNDMTGRTIKTVAANSSNIKIDLNNIPQGTYLLQVTHGSEVTTQKIVIAK